MLSTYLLSAAVWFIALVLSEALIIREQVPNFKHRCSTTLECSVLYAVTCSEETGECHCLPHYKWVSSKNKCVYIDNHPSHVICDGCDLKAESKKAKKPKRTTLVQCIEWLAVTFGVILIACLPIILLKRRKNKPVHRVIRRALSSPSDEKSESPPPSYDELKDLELPTYHQVMSSCKKFSVTDLPPIYSMSWIRPKNLKLILNRKDSSNNYENMSELSDNSPMTATSYLTPDYPKSPDKIHAAFAAASGGLTSTQDPFVSTPGAASSSNEQHKKVSKTKSASFSETSEQFRPRCSTEGAQIKVSRTKSTFSSFSSFISEIKNRPDRQHSKISGSFSNRVYKMSDLGNIPEKSHASLSRTTSDISDSINGTLELRCSPERDFDFICKTNSAFDNPGYDPIEDGESPNNKSRSRKVPIGSQNSHPKLARQTSEYTAVKTLEFDPLLQNKHKNLSRKVSAPAEYHIADPPVAPTKTHKLLARKASAPLTQNTFSLVPGQSSDLTSTKTHKLLARKASAPTTADAFTLPPGLSSRKITSSPRKSPRLSEVGPAIFRKSSMLTDIKNAATELVALADQSGNNAQRKMSDISEYKNINKGFDAPQQKRHPALCRQQSVLVDVHGCDDYHVQNQIGKNEWETFTDTEPNTRLKIPKLSIENYNDIVNKSDIQNSILVESYGVENKVDKPDNKPINENKGSSAFLEIHSSATKSHSFSGTQCDTSKVNFNSVPPSPKSGLISMMQASTSSSPSNHSELSFENENYICENVEPCRKSIPITTNAENIPTRRHSALFRTDSTYTNPKQIKTDNEHNLNSLVELTDSNPQSSTMDSLYLKNSPQRDNVLFEFAEDI